MVWAKAVGPVDWLHMFFESDDAYFDLSVGAVGTVTGNGTASIVDEGDGWYRCILVSSRSGSFSYSVRAADADGSNTYLGTGVPVLRLFGPQVAVGQEVTPFLVTAAGGQGGQQPFEDFESLWDSNEEYVFSLAEAGATAALYPTAPGGVKDFEDFEELWDANEAYLYALGPVTNASYSAAEAGGPFNFENFEQGFPDLSVYFNDLADVIAGPGISTADYDPGGPSQLFEDFGDADPTLWNDGGTYDLVLPAVTAAMYDVGAPQAFEDFEEEWPTIVMTTV